VRRGRRVAGMSNVDVDGTVSMFASRVLGAWASQRKPLCFSSVSRRCRPSASSSATRRIGKRPLASAANAATLLVITDAPMPLRCHSLGPRYWQTGLELELERSRPRGRGGAERMRFERLQGHPAHWRSYVRRPGYDGDRKTRWRRLAQGSRGRQARCLSRLSER